MSLRADRTCLRPDNHLDHSYPAVSNTTRGSLQDLDVRGLCTPFPATPPNSPASKKSKADLLLHELQENIITALNNRADSLEEMNKANSNTIEELKSSLFFVNAEIADLQKSKVELTAKVKVTEICKGVAPELAAKMSEAVDVAHRLGRPVAGRARAIIILFVLHWVRDVIWKNAENSDYLKECKLRFGEDLTNEEKASRALLWPYIQKAHNEGKKAYFIGSKAYVDGREIVPEKMDTT
ncbi:Recombination-associated protein RdgC [Labeo rohita]|uniref:Recombination-associated protein RdgC n=1 Tax=Labeo rohita TaxID=84645 RepID=A0ABQ8L665_LABRO|nr:Recombination-associated protein RdgC [Labeo rohita]